MARQLTYVAPAAPARVRVSQVPDDVIAELETAWKRVRETGEDVHIIFDTPREAAMFLAHAKAWAGSRKGGRLMIRRLPGKAAARLPDHVLQFTISPYDPSRVPGRKSGK